MAFDLGFRIIVPNLFDIAGISAAYCGLSREGIGLIVAGEVIRNSGRYTRGMIGREKKKVSGS